MLLRSAQDQVIKCVDTMQQDNKTYFVDIIKDNPI